MFNFRGRNDEPWHFLGSHRQTLEGPSIPQRDSDTIFCVSQSRETANWLRISQPCSAFIGQRSLCIFMVTACHSPCSWRYKMLHVPDLNPFQKIVGWCFNGTWTTTPLEDEAVDMGMGHNVTVSEVHIFWESYVLGFPVCYRSSSMLLFFLIGGESWYHSRFAEFADVRALGP